MSVGLLCVLSIEIWMRELDAEQDTDQKNRCIRTVMYSENQFERQSITRIGFTQNRRSKVTFQEKYCETENGICWTCDESIWAPRQNFWVGQICGPRPMFCKQSMAYKPQHWD